MGFAFEDLQVYQKALDFSVAIIDVIEDMETPRKHYRLIEQLEASCTSVALNISEGKGRFSKKEFRHFFTLIEPKSRMPQIQGVEGEAVVMLLRTLDNAGDGVSSAFPMGKQNEDSKE